MSKELRQKLAVWYGSNACFEAGECEIRPCEDCPCALAKVDENLAFVREEAEGVENPFDGKIGDMYIRQTGKPDDMEICRGAVNLFRKRILEALR